MATPLRTTFAILLLALLPFTASGCIVAAAAAGGAAGYAWYRGEFQATVDAAPQRAATAAERGLRDLDIKEIKSSATEIDGRVTGRTALDKEVVITIKRQTENTSSIAIRVGTFGDEALSQKIFEKIQARL
ncbi:MAG: DUF3568 family protein [Planctomycetes bacterium]|nr:DUF3568 family protein [Planctomycetota bacterium]